MPLPDFSRWGEIEVKPMSSVRRITAHHLAHAWVTVPKVTQYDKADITRLEDLRKRFSPRVEEAGGKLDKAKELGLKVIGETEFFQLL